MEPNGNKEIEKAFDEAIDNVTQRAGNSIYPDDALKYSQSAMNLAKARVEYFWPTG